MRPNVSTFLCVCPSCLSVARVGTPTLAWLTQCSEICTELGERIRSVAKLITNFAAANDHDSCVSLRVCSVVCLSNLAELYHILSHHPLWKLPRVAIKQCEKTMYLMSDMSKELMNDDDMRHLPPYAGVSTQVPVAVRCGLMFQACQQCSWARAATLLRREVAMMSFESYITHPDKGVNEMRKCIGETIAFMTDTSNRFYSASSFENPSRHWGKMIPAD